MDLNTLSSRPWAFVALIVIEDGFGIVINRQLLFYYFLWKKFFIALQPDYRSFTQRKAFLCLLEWVYWKTD